MTQKSRNRRHAEETKRIMILKIKYCSFVPFLISIEFAASSVGSVTVSPHDMTHDVTS